MPHVGCDEDVDECRDPQNLCIRTNRACVNSPGSFSCRSCVEGYTYSKSKSGACVNVDECSNKTRADELCPGTDNQCTDLIGTFKCCKTAGAGCCPAGEKMDAKGLCKDINECEDPSNECAAFFEGLRDCVNAVGNYSCGPCKSGYQMNFNGFCDDKDECKAPGNFGFCGHKVIAYNWFDVTKIGTAGPPLNDDQQFTAELPFHFPFYESSFVSIQISSNGYMFLSGATIMTGETSRIPNTRVPNNLIAPYWTDLDPTKSSNAIVYTYGNTSLFVVEWANVPYWQKDTKKGQRLKTAHFQAILYPNGDIKFQYKHIENVFIGVKHPSAPSVGVENSDGTKGVQVSYDYQYFPRSNEAVLLHPCESLP